MRLSLLRTLGLFAFIGPLLVTSVGCNTAPPSASSTGGAEGSAPPTHSVTPIPSGYKTYSNTNDHYSVTYPAAWFIDPSRQPGGAVSIRNKAYDLTHVFTQGLWKLDIVVTGNPHGLTAKQWADQDMNAGVYPQTVLSETSVNIGGEIGIRRHISQAGLTGYGFWATHDGRVILMDATDQPEFQPIVDSIVASIVFSA